MHTYLFSYCPATGMQNGNEGLLSTILVGRGLLVKRLIFLNFMVYFTKICIIIGFNIFKTQVCKKVTSLCQDNFLFIDPK